ncbi:MAG: hypothetical protein U1F54_17980 [Burkholderiales bacterium]
MKSIVIAVAFAAVGVTTAHAQVANPDNDSAAFFAQQKSSPPTPKPIQQLPKIGEVSQDGLYVYSGNEHGWVHQVHRYGLAGGKATQHTDSLTHDSPKPATTGSVAIQSGPFADRGA